MFARLARGFGYAWRGLSHLAGRPNLWKFAALPVILNTLLFIVAGWAYVHFFPDLLHKIMHRPEVWYLWIVYVLVIVLLLVAFALLVLFTFTMVGCALAGPFLDLLSDRVEQQLGRVEAPLSFGEAFRTMMRGVVVSLVTLALFLVSQIVVFALWLLPVIGQILSAVLGPLAGAYFFSVQFFDYPLGRRRLTTRARYRFVNQHRAEAVGFGLAVFLTTLVPLLNFVMLPVAAVGATLLVRTLEEEDARPSAAG